MSDNSQNHDSGSEQDAQRSPSPFMKAALEYIDENERADRSSATSLPRQATVPTPHAIPVGTTQARSSFIWPQPRGTPRTANEAVDAGTRRIPAALRNTSVATQSSMSTFQSDRPVRDQANASKGTSSAAPKPMLDQRPGGGSFAPDGFRPKSRKMKWTAENDRSLLLFGLGRDISGIEYQPIADSFKEKPTAKAVQERLTKLRAAGRKVLKESGIFDADAVRDTPTVSRAPSVVQTATPSEQQRARKRPRKSDTPTTPVDTPATPEATKMIPISNTLNEQTSQHPSQRMLDRLTPAPTAGPSAGTLTHSTGPPRHQPGQPPMFSSQPTTQLGQ